MTSLDTLNAKFRYEADVRDGWTVMRGDVLRGDCDDYALTAAFILCGESWIRFWFRVLTFQIVFVQVTVPWDGSNHLMLKFRRRYIDNIHKKWLTSRPYDLRFPPIVLPPLVAIKMLLGKVRD